MKTTANLLGAAVLAAGLCAATVRAQDAIVNGGFVNASTDGSWNISGSAIAGNTSGRSSDGDGWYGMLLNGNDAAYNGTIYQVVNVTPGQTYRFMYDYARNGGYNCSLWVDVFPGAVAAADTNSYPIGSGGLFSIKNTTSTLIPVYVTQTASITPATSQITVRFSDALNTTSNKRDLYVDNVRLIGGLLVWNGTAAGNTWNTAGANTVWLNNTNAAPFADSNYVTFDGLAQTNVVNIPGPVLPSTVVVNNTAADATNAVTFQGAGSIGGATTALRKLGAGTLTIATTNSFGGPVAISGTVYISSLKNADGTPSSLGAPTNATYGIISLGGDPVAGTLVYTGTGDTSDRVVNLAGGAAGANLFHTGTGLLKFTSSFTASAAGALTLSNSTAGPGEIAGSIVDSSSGVVSLNKLGAGTWTLSGANTYSGTTTVSGGTLRVNGSSGGSLGGSGAVTVQSGATLAVVGNASINGPVTIQDGGALAVGTTNLDAMTLNNALSMADTASVTLNISKNGGVTAQNQIAGLWLLTFGGTLTVTNITSDGTPLAKGDSFQLFSIPGSGGRFSNYILPPLPAGLNWDVTPLSTSGSIAVSDVSATPVFTPAAGGYIVTNPLTVTISTVTPGATIYYTMDGSTPTSASPSGLAPVTVLVPENTNLTIRAYAHAAGLTDSGTASADYATEPRAVWVSPLGDYWTSSYNWSKGIIPNGSGITADFSTVTLTADSIITLDSPQTIGNLVFGDAGTNYNWQLDKGTAGSLTLAGSQSPTISVLNQTTTIGAAIKGTNGLTKAGNGTLALTTANTYSGGTIINAGTLNIGNGGSTGSLGTGPLVNNGALVVNMSGTTSFTFPAEGTTGTGPITATADTLVFNGSVTNGANQSYTATAVGANNHGIKFPNSAATVLVATNGASVSLSGDTGSDNQGSRGALIIDTSSGNGTVNLDTSIARGGALYGYTNFIVNAGTGTVNVAGTHLASGWSTTPVSLAGAVNIAGNLSRGPLTIVATAPSLVSGVLSAAYPLTKSGPATLVISNTQTYTGATTVSNGTLLVDGSLAKGSAVTVAAGTLGGVGTINGKVTVQPGATLAPGDTAVGTLLLTSNLTLSGNVLIRVDKALSPSNSAATVSSTITNLGTGILMVTNLNAGAPLAVGDKFYPFSGKTVVGGAALGIAPAPGAGLAWTNKLAVDGSIEVITGIASYPTNITMLVNGRNANLSWPSTHLGWLLEVQTNGVQTGLSTNWFPWLETANVTETNLVIDPANPAVFFRLRKP